MKDLPVIRVFDNVTVTKNTTETSTVILSTIQNKHAIDIAGFFSIQAVISGDGTLSIGYVCSNDGVTYRAPEGEYSGSNFAPILTGLTKTSGASSDGKIIFQFNPHFAKFYKIVAVETGTANDAVITADVARF